ncbi:hypothetical protein IWZ00DRAFT_199615 [Phyllosticta capitalensis]
MNVDETYGMTSADETRLVPHDGIHLCFVFFCHHSPPVTVFTSLFCCIARISCQATAKIPTIRRLSHHFLPLFSTLLRGTFTFSWEEGRHSASFFPDFFTSPEAETAQDNNATESANDPATPTASSLAAAAGSPDADASPATPAPLNIPPSRARRQFAARLAERKRAAAEQETGDGEVGDEQQQQQQTGDDWTERYGDAAAVAEASSTSAAGGRTAAAPADAGGAMRFSNLFKQSAEDSEEEDSSDEEGEELVMKEGVLARKRSGVGSSAGSSTGSGGGSDKERE